MSNQSKRRVAAMYATLGLSLLSAAPLLAADVTASWIGGDGTWADPTKWSTNPVYPNNGSPAGTSYDAVVAASGGPYALTLDSNITIDSLTLDSAAATVRQTGNTFTLLHGLTLTAGTYALSSGTLVTPSLDGSSAFTFDGSGFGPRLLCPTVGGTLTIASGATVRALSGIGTIGRVDGWVVNNGTLVADSGYSITLLGPFSNNGTLQMNGGTIVIPGSITTAALGTFVNTSVGGALLLRGALDNTGAALTLDSGTGPVRLGHNGSILGGTISGSGAGKVTVDARSPIIDGVTIAGTGLSVISNGLLTVRTGLTLSDAIVEVGTSSSGFTGTLDFDGTQTLAGTGEIHMNGRGIVKPFTGTLTIGPGVAIRAKGNYNEIGDSAHSLINNGTIASEGGNANLNIKAGTLDNAGTLNMSAGYNTIENLQNTGTLNVAGAGKTELLGTWHNAGAINVNNGTIELGGTFTLADVGTLNRTGGNVRISGLLDNTGTTLALNATTGSWLLRYGGTIKGGTISTSGGATLEFDWGDNPGGALDGVTIASDLTIPHAAKVTVRNGLTLSNASMTLDAGFGTFLRFDGTQILGGTGEIILDGPYGTVTPINGTLTIGPGITIRATDVSGAGQVGENDDSPLINQGTIFSNVPNGSIFVRGSTVTNTGTIKSSAGAYLRIHNLQNAGTVNAAGDAFVLGGVWQNQGVITTTASNSFLGGTFSASDIGDFTRIGGNLFISGQLNNAGNILNTAIFNGPVSLSGTISGGTIITTATAPLSLTTNHGTPTLDSVTLDTDATVTGSVTWRIRNGLTLSAGRRIIFTSGEDLISSSEHSINGEGEIQFASGGCVIQTDGTGTLTFGSGITVRTTTPTAGASILGSIVNDGTLWLNSANGYLTVGGDVTNNGMIRSDAGNLSLGGTESWNVLVNHGTIAAQAPGRTALIEGDFTNHGKLAARSGGTLSVESETITNLVGSTLSGGRWEAYTGSTLSLVGRSVTTNNATVVLDGPGSVFAAVDSLNDNAGTFEIDHGRNFSTVGALVNSGTLRVGQNSTLTVNGAFTNTGKIKGKGTIVAGNLDSSGTIEPGESAGVLTIDGNLRMTPSSVLEIEIGGTTAGAEFDVLDVSGALTLDGTLKISLIDGFAPGAEDAFEFLHFAAATGQFNAVILPELPPGVVWDESVLLTGGPASVPEPGGAVLLAVASAVLAGRRRRRG